MLVVINTHIKLFNLLIVCYLKKYAEISFSQVTNEFCIFAANTIYVVNTWTCVFYFFIHLFSVILV